MNNLYEYRINASGGERILFHRNTAADQGVIHQILINQDYNIERLRRGNELKEFYFSLVSHGVAPFIVDCGANIGTSAVWFATVYPHSVTVAIEAERENFELLTMNSVGLGIEAYHAAVGAESGQTNLIDPGEGEWGYRTDRYGSGPAVEQISMRKVVVDQMAKGRIPFIAKIDIEGGEDDLFRNSLEWVDFFPLIIIELHDWLLPKKNTSKNFVQCMATRDRDLVYIGENIFSIRNF